MEKKITFQILVKAKDLWQFSMYHVNRGAQGLFNLIFTAAVVIVLIAGWTSLPDSQRLALLMCALIFTVIQPLMLYYKAKRQARRPEMKTPLILQFGSGGLTVRQQEQEVVFAWEQIGRVHKKAAMTIIYVDRLHAYLIPKEFYNGKEDDFFQLLRTNMPKERLKKV